MSKPSKQIKIAIDLDDTICQTSLGIINYIKLNHPDKLDLFKNYLNRPEFKSENPDEQALVIEALNSEGFFLNLEPYSGVIESILSLSEKYKVYFCTSAGSYKYAASEKMTWVKKHFGEDWLSRMVITRAKDIVDVDILIDDRVDNAHHFLNKPKWQQIAFKQSWNSKLNLPRIKNWGEAGSVIENFISENFN